MEKIMKVDLGFRHNCRKCKKRIKTPIYVKYTHSGKKDTKYYHISCYYNKLVFQINLSKGWIQQWTKTKNDLEKYKKEILNEMKEKGKNKDEQ